VTLERSRQLGQLLMGGSVLALLVFVVGAMRRSYVVLALPLFAAVAVVSGLGFWLGLTMFVQDWDDPADYGVDD